MGTMFSIRFYPYTLHLKRPITLANSERTTTPALMVEVEQDGIVGFGEASMPPYRGEDVDSASAFVSKVDVARFPNPFHLNDILREIDMLAPGNSAAKAALDIALHDWLGKKIGYAWHQIWGLNPDKIPPTSYTISIGTTDAVRQAAQDAADYHILKVKLGRDNDKQMISAIREVTEKPIRVDVNQGWTDRGTALHMIEWLAKRNVELVEQPLPKDRLDDMAWMRERSPLPIVGDESIERLSDIRKVSGVFDGLNIKLMKCTGMREAYSMITVAKGLGLSVMLGCMTETSCAISAAAQLAPMADWVDLDGAALITNDLFEGATLIGGKVTPADRPGIGAVKR